MPDEACIICTELRQKAETAHEAEQAASGDSSALPVTSSLPLSGLPEIKLTFRKCILCRRAVCDDHRSAVDPDYCQDCMADAQSADFSKVEDHFVDAQGVAHDCKVFRPVGDFWITTADAIRQNPDESLEKMLNFYYSKILLAQKVLDRVRTIKSMVEIEIEERKVQKSRALRAEKATGIRLVSPTGSSTLVNKPAESAPRRGRPPAGTAKPAATPTLQEALKMLMDLAKQKKTS